MAEEAETSLVEFRDANIKQQWHKGGATLLELAEAQGLSPPYSCRSGNCGSCAVKLHAGTVTYRTKPSAQIAENNVLICCAVPAKGTNQLVLELYTQAT